MASLNNEDPMLGDVIISVETAQRQADERHHLLCREIVFYSSMESCIYLATITLRILMLKRWKPWEKLLPQVELNGPKTCVIASSLTRNTMSQDILDLKKDIGARIDALQGIFDVSYLERRMVN